MGRARERVGHPNLVLAWLLLALLYTHCQAAPPTAGPTSAQDPEASQAPASGELQYQLPSWFNYELYRKFYGKPSAPAQLTAGARKAYDEAHKRVYLRTALRVFEQRALYRAGKSNTLTSVNELSDWVGTPRYGDRLDDSG